MAFDYSVKFNAVDRISEKIEAINDKMVRMRQTASSVSKRIGNGIAQGAGKAKKGIELLDEKITSLSKKKLDFPTSLTSLFAQLGSIALPVSRAIEFEKTFAGVKKVVTGTDAEIAQLRENILGMTSKIPKTASELNEIAESGAKMGLKINELTNFVEIVSKASVAFDMSAEETGQAFGKISNQLGLSIPQMEIFGDKVNHLADNTASSARNIIDITKRTSGVMSSLKFDTGTVVGLSAFADQMSVTSEIGATAMNQILNKIRGTEEGARLLKEKGGFALIDIAEKFKKLEGVARVKAIEDLFGAGEGSRMFEKLINQTGVLKKSLDLALSTDTLGSMSREFANVSNTTANKIILMKNAFDRLAIGIGDALLPSVNEIIATIAPLMDKMTNWAKDNKGLIITIAKIVAVGAILTAGLIIAKTALVPLILAMKAYVLISRLVTASIWLYNLALWANPLTWVVLGIIAVGVAIAGLIIYWEEITTWVGTLWDKFLGFANWVGGELVQAFEGIKSVFMTLTTPIRYVSDLIDNFLNKFDIFTDAKKKVESIAGGVGDLANEAWGNIKGFFGVDNTTEGEKIDNVQKNHTVVDVNVIATGAIATEQKARTTSGRVQLNTAENGV